MSKTYIVQHTLDNYQTVENVEMVIFGLGSLEFYAGNGDLILGLAAGQWVSVVPAEPTTVDDNPYQIELNDIVKVLDRPGRWKVSLISLDQEAYLHQVGGPRVTREHVSKLVRVEEKQKAPK